MPWGFAAAAVGTIVAGSMQADAAKDAAAAQSDSATAGIGEQRRQFDAVQQLLSPYVNAGNKSLQGQLDLTGLGAPGSQQAAIDAIQASPQFTSALKLGENRILANASATGGLRGGNTQAALAQFSPALLAASINDQYSRLGGLTSIGQNAAAGVGNAGMQVGNNVTSLLGQQGAAQAGAALASGRAYSGVANGLASLGGYYAAQQPQVYGGFRTVGGSQANNGYGGYGNVMYGDGYGPM